MQDRKVWKLFSLLRDSEKINFKQWLLYELGEKQQFVQKLYACMLEYPRLRGDDKEVWSWLYPNSPYDDARLRKLCRDLSKQIEFYLALQVFREDSRKQEIALLQAYNHREASDLFLKSSKKLKREAGKTPEKDASYYRYLYEIEVEIQRYLSKYIRNSAEREKLFPRQYEHMLNYFDAFWAEEKLELALAKGDMRKRLDADSHELLLDELVKKLQGDEYWQKNDRLQVYVRVFKLLRGEGNEQIDHLLDLIRRTEDQWTEEELRNFLTSLINAYIRKLNELGDEDTAYELFYLFEWGIETSLFFVDNNLPEIVYKNLIGICLRMEYFTKARSYMDDLKSLLPEARQEECYRFNLGRYYFSTQSYKDVIACLAGQPFSNVYDEIEARTYLLQAQFESSSEEPVWIARQLKTLTRFVRYQDLPPHGKQAMINGFKLFIKLVHSYSAHEYEEVRNKILSTKPLFRAGWLLKKTEEKIPQRYVKLK